MYDRILGGALGHGQIHKARRGTTPAPLRPKQASDLWEQLLQLHPYFAAQSRYGPTAVQRAVLSRNPRRESGPPMV